MEPRELDLTDDPYASFDSWLQNADQVVDQAEAMALATVDAEGRPSQRIVLYKGRSGAGLRFFTNYRSAKARDLEANQDAALLFFWQPLKRQIRIEGSIERLDREESDGYFASRDRGSQLGAWASAQSETLESREALLDGLAEYAERFEGEAVPCPPHWGGYRLLPRCFEFWQGLPDRLHDRFLYESEAAGWKRRRLAP